MSLDPKTYNFCLQSLRYIHDILGTDTILKEIRFLDNLQPTTHKPDTLTSDPHTHETSSSQTIDPPNPTYNSHKILHDPLNENILEPTKSVTIDKTLKYQRNSCPDDLRCHANKNTGQRCTFKAENDSTLCSRHRLKVLHDTNTS
jgi:hypothetical protein